MPRGPNNTKGSRRRRPFRVEGLTAKEVAARTGESMRVVRHNLYRGVEKLRGVLWCMPGDGCDPAVRQQSGGTRR
jgi:hypothetical protein